MSRIYKIIMISKIRFLITWAVVACQNRIGASED